MWRKIFKGALGYLLAFGAVTQAFATTSPQGIDKNQLFLLKKRTEYNFFLSLYAVGKYEWELKKELLAQTINCIKNSQDEAQLQSCIQEFKNGLKRIRKNVELYGHKFLEELRRKE